MDYQERVSTREDIKALYERVCNMPHVRRYRGYTDTHSYEWDPISKNYIRRANEHWFDNPGYDPNCDIPNCTEEELKAELKRGLDPEPIPEDVTGYVKPPVRTGDYIPDPAPRVLDSGHRRQFESGAVRDICEGKGRCDLLPLDVVGHALANPTFKYIHQFQVEDGDYERLYDALSSSGVFHDYYTLILEVAKQFEDGAKKYGDSNWQKGIPVRCYIDSAVRHYLKYLRGDKDEPHDRAFCWNILCCIWTCIHKPELNDYAMKEEEKDVNR